MLNVAGHSHNAKVILRDHMGELIRQLETYVRENCNTYKEAKKVLQNLEKSTYANTGEREVVRYVISRFEQEHEEVQLNKAISFD